MHRCDLIKEMNYCLNMYWCFCFPFQEMNSVLPCANWACLILLQIGFFYIRFYSMFKTLFLVHIHLHALFKQINYADEIWDFSPYECAERLSCHLIIVRHVLDKYMLMNFHLSFPRPWPFDPRSVYKLKKQVKHI